MTIVFNTDAQEYNLKLANALKEIPEFNAPEWIILVKSSPSKERPIDDLDFSRTIRFPSIGLLPTTPKIGIFDNSLISSTVWTFLS